MQLPEPGTYQTACKPGMVGDGIRGDFKVTGDAVQIDTEGKFKEAADNYKRYVNSQTDALIPATEVFVDAVKSGDIPAAKAQFPDRAHLLRAHRAGRRVVPRRPRPAHRPA